MRPGIPHVGGRGVSACGVGRERARGEGRSAERKRDASPSATRRKRRARGGARAEGDEQREHVGVQITGVSFGTFGEAGDKRGRSWLSSSFLLCFLKALPLLPPLQPLCDEAHRARER